MQVARQSQVIEQAEAQRVELEHQANELASEQAALQEQQRAAEQEHERLAALAAELATQQAALNEQRSLVSDAREKAKVCTSWHDTISVTLCIFKRCILALPARAC